IALLRAREFSTRTRRVAEFAGSGRAESEPDGKLRAGAAPGKAKAPGQASVPLPVSANPSAAVKAEDAAPRRPAEAEAEFTPQARAEARTTAARNAKFDRSRYEVVRSLERLEAWIARAHERGRIAIV